MHTTIAAAAAWQFEDTQNRFLYSLIMISIFLACYHVAKKWEKIVLLWGPCSAEHAKHAQGRSDGGRGIRYIYPPKISPPKIFMGYFFFFL